MQSQEQGLRERSGWIGLVPGTQQTMEKYGENVEKRGFLHVEWHDPFGLHWTGEELFIL